MSRLVRTTVDNSLVTRIAEPESLFLAWKKVRANRGCAGADAVSLVAFERDLRDNLLGTAPTFPSIAPSESGSTVCFIAGIRSVPHPRLIPLLGLCKGITTVVISN